MEDAEQRDMEEEREDKERSFLRGLLIRIESKSFILPMLALVAACSPLLVASACASGSTRKPSSSSSSSSQTRRLRSLTTMISLPLLDLNEGNEEEEEEAARWRSSSLLLNRCDDAKAVAK